MTRTGAVGEADVVVLRRVVVATGVVVVAATGAAFGVPTAVGVTVEVAVTVEVGVIVAEETVAHGHDRGVVAGVAVGRVPEAVAPLHLAVVLLLAAGRDELLAECRARVTNNVFLIRASGWADVH